jgi:hypothetical protein
MESKEQGILRSVALETIGNKQRTIAESAQINHSFPEIEKHFGNVGISAFLPEIFADGIKVMIDCRRIESAVEERNDALFDFKHNLSIAIFQGIDADIAKTRWEKTMENLICSGFVNFRRHDREVHGFNFYGNAFVIEEKHVVVVVDTILERFQIAVVSGIEAQITANDGFSHFFAVSDETNSAIIEPQNKFPLFRVLNLDIRCVVRKAAHYEKLNIVQRYEISHFHPILN